MPSLDSTESSPPLTQHVDNETANLSDASQPRQQVPPTRGEAPSSNRESRMLYVEKYGLNRPGWNQCNQKAPLDSDDSDDDRPIAAPVISYKRASMAPRPLAPPPVRMDNVMHDPHSQRPRRFIKPAPYSQVTASLAPPDMQGVQKMAELLKTKLYMEGCLAKCDAKTERSIWRPYHVEHSGSHLLLWDMEREGDRITPEYIKLNDLDIHMEDVERHVFSLRSAGVNRFLFHAKDNATLQQWVRSLQLYYFERTRVEEMFTRRFLVRPVHLKCLSKQVLKMDGSLQVRFKGNTEWKEYWATVTDRVVEKKLFGKKRVPGPGQFKFYTSKKKQATLVASIEVITRAYMVYPENPKLIEGTTLFTIEGIVRFHGEQGRSPPTDQPTSILLMAKNAKELAQWLIGTYDAFKLYGRPDKLLDNTSDNRALNFGENVSNQRDQLFLENDDVSKVNVQGNATLDLNHAFVAILANKAKNQDPASAMRSMSRSNSTPMVQPVMQTAKVHRQLSDGNHLVKPQRRLQAMPPPSLPQQRLVSQMLRPNAGRVIYASDDSDSDENDEEDENEEEDEEESDSGPSVFDKDPPGRTQRIHSAPYDNITPLSTQPPSNASVHSAASEPLEKGGTLPLITGDEDFAQSVFNGVQQFQSPSKPHQRQSMLPTRLQDTQVPAYTKAGSDATRSQLGQGRRSSSHELLATAHRPPLKHLYTQQATHSNGSGSGNSSRSSTQSMSASDSSSSLHSRQRSLGKVNPAPLSPTVKSGTGRSPPSTFSDSSSVTSDSNRRPTSHFLPNWDPACMDPRMMYGPFGAPMIPGGVPPVGLYSNPLPENDRGRYKASYSPANRRVSGQPLVKIPHPSTEHRAGLVGVISQLEDERREMEANKARLLDKEKERMLLLMQQQQQQQQQQQAMMNPYMMNPYMMNPYMPNPYMMNMMGMPMAMMQNMAMHNPGNPRLSAMSGHSYGSHYPPMDNRRNDDIQEEDEDDDDLPIRRAAPPVSVAGSRS